MRSATQPPTVRGVIDVDLPGPRISRHVYGHFAGHLGRCIAVNVGSGTIREAGERAEYLTRADDSPMAALRRANGMRARPGTPTRAVLTAGALNAHNTPQEPEAVRPRPLVLRLRLPRHAFATVTVPLPG